MLALAKFIDQVSLSLNKIALRGAVLAVLVMVFAAAWQVVARYILDAPPVWTEELARRAMVWAVIIPAIISIGFFVHPLLGIGLLLIYPLQILRTTLNSNLPIKKAFLYSFIIKVLTFIAFR